MDTSKNEDSITLGDSHKKQNKKYWFFSLLPLPLIIWAVVVNVFQSSISLLPCTNDVSIAPLHDSITVSDSTIKESFTHIEQFKTVDSSAAILFTLGKEIDFPYAGVLFNTFRNKKDSTFINLSKMNYIELDVAVSGGKCPLTLCLSEFIDGYTSFQKALSSRPVEYTLVAEPVMKQYRIKLDDFQTNPWWFQQQPVTQQGIPDGSLKKIMNLVIKNSDYETKGVPISIEVKNIRFGRNLFPLNLTIIGLLVVFYAGLIFLKRNSKSRAVSTIVLPDDQLEISTYPDDDTNRM